jgi:predicted RNase H-like nuclease
VGAYWWYWGVARNQVLGNSHEGYIIVPHRIIKDIGDCP